MSDNQRRNNHYGIDILIVSLIIIILFVIIGIVLFFVFSAKHESNRNQSIGGNPINQTETEVQLFTRNATMSDIVLNYSSDLTLGYKFEFTPSKDIKGLAFSVSFYDSDGTCVVKKAKTIGNVVKGGYYTFTFSASEFSLSQLWQISSCTTTIKSGTVSIFS